MPLVPVAALAAAIAHLRTVLERLSIGVEGEFSLVPTLIDVVTTPPPGRHRHRLVAGVAAG